MRYEDDHAVAARDALAFHTFGYYFEFENISFLHTDIISHIAAQVQRRRISCGCRLAEYDFSLCLRGTKKFTSPRIIRKKQLTILSEAKMDKKKKDAARRRARKLDEANLAMSLKDENNGIYHFENELAEWIEEKH